jgi:hypothetical protein
MEADRGNHSSLFLTHKCMFHSDKIKGDIKISCKEATIPQRTIQGTKLRTITVTVGVIFANNTLLM